MRSIGTNKPSKPKISQMGFKIRIQKNVA
uniref:Uncharacterized protein n=1 Tax=Arundo donax TaxID=35708 RepID=A0A0A9HIL8_ARUDO